MTALTADRNTPRADGDVQEFPVLAATLIYAGSMVMLNASGFALSGATATGQIVVGRAEQRIDNSSGANGDLNIPVRSGVFQFANSAAGDLIAAAEIGDDCYLVDDQTVAKTDGTGTRSIAGKIVNVDAQGVWVSLGIS